MSWFEDLQPAVQAAVVAGGVALLTALITATSTATNLVLKDWLDHRATASTERELRRTLYRKYADPLTSAAESLYWRFREIFEVGRSAYLQPGGGLTRFEKYKASSTRYRVAALLGWMRALKRELVLCNAQPDPSVRPMRDALHELETSLAEGAHIERDVATRLAQLWGLDDLAPDEAGRDVNAVVDRCLHEHQVASVAALEDGQLAVLLREVAQIMSRNAGKGVVPGAIVAASTATAVRVLSTKEAWIYRDWQDAIGDWMLVENVGGARRFDVKGYRLYDSERPSDDGGDEWLERLAELTDGLDVGADDTNDARIAQLRGVYHAVANLIVRFHNAEPQLSSVRETTLEAVRATLKSAAEASDP